MNSVKMDGILVQGHRVASGSAADNPFGDATIRLQQPYFAKLGLDISGYYTGTLNISIAPRTFQITHPKITFHDVKWSSDHAAETFSFADCAVFWNGQEYSGVLYYPHPETKIGHFKDPSVLEVLAPKLPGIKYGDRLEVSVSSSQVSVSF